MPDLTWPNIIALILLAILAVPVGCLAWKIRKGKRIKIDREDL
jgi:hypothetical protein